MVVIRHCIPHLLYAYPTVPLTENVAASVQHDFAIGSFARFGNPSVTLSIQNRPDFHSLSTYSVREKLDLEDSLEQFVMIDDRTADSHAIWYAETTENSKANTAMAIEGGHPPITHEGEDFTVWQARILTQDLPIQWACFDVGVRDIVDDMEDYIYPYDPHNPQQEPYTLGRDFSSREGARGFLGPAYIQAEYEEITWSTDIQYRRTFLPVPPAVVKLTDDAARESGLLSEWASALHVPHPGKTISMTAPYDWDSPKWSPVGTNVSKRGLRYVSVTSAGFNTSAGACENSRLLGPEYGGFRSLSTKNDINPLLLRHDVEVY